MLFGFDLNHLLLFPIKDNEARKYFLVGCLLYLAGFFIPILPWLVTYGYSALIVRQVLNGEQPHMVPWDNWEILLKDGARLLGIGLVYSLPLLLLMLIFFLVLFAFPFFSISLQDGNSQGPGVASILFILVTTGSFILVFPLSLAIGLIVPVAEVHAVAKDDFMAGLNVREWWPIFKQNWGGFVVAMAILYGVSMVMTFAMQFLMITIILICVLPLFMAIYLMYYIVIQFALFASAYKEGEEKMKLEVAKVPLVSPADL